MSTSGTAQASNSAVRELLANSSLKKMIEGLETLPSVPSLYQELMTALQSDDASAEKAARIISQDMGMVTKILQVVNSPLYGLRTQISNPAQAVALLGLDAIKSLVLSTKVFQQFDQSKLPFFSLEVLWMHGMSVGAHARSIAKVEQAERTLQEDALTAGLLHDVGILILASNFPDKYTEMLAAMQSHGSFEWETEKHVLGCTHGELGGYLLGTWGLPEAVVEAVAFHHQPSICIHSSLTPLAAVHFADVVAEEAETEAQGLDPVPPDLDYLTLAGQVEKLQVWRAACQQRT
jgi:HD-like signal output (HDOD) protein